MAIVTLASDPARFARLRRAERVPRGHVRLTCTDPAFSAVILLGPEAPKITAGNGGWSVIGRPRDVGMTVWDGVEPYQLSLSLMLDGWAARQSQEATIRGLARVARGDRESAPGTVRIEGIPLPARYWVIEGIDYGDPILRQRDGERYRQPITLTLRQYVPPQFIRRRKSPTQSSTKTVIVRAQQGDTPAKIAKRRRLKSWKVIRDLNRKVVKKANQKLKQGTKIRVPATKHAARVGGKDRRR